MPARKKQHVRVNVFALDQLIGSTTIMLAAPVPGVFVVVTETLDEASAAVSVLVVNKESCTSNSTHVDHII